MPAIISGSFSATGTSTEVSLFNTHSKDRTQTNKFNVSVRGTFSGTIQLQRYFDDLGTWGSVNEWTEPGEKMLEECEDEVEYRFECTAFTSGTINYRLGVR